MKKIFVALLCLLGLTGCKDIKKDSIAFELEGNPSTGFEWTCEYNKEIIELSQTAKKTTKKKNVSGAPVMFQYRIKGLKEGETTIKCTYARSWEEDESLRTIVEYNVKVDKELKYTIEKVK